MRENRTFPSIEVLIFQPTENKNHQKLDKSIGLFRFQLLIDENYQFLKHEQNIRVTIAQ